MKFDVIIGNPPYQLSDGGGSGTSATPIYHKFVEQAKKLQPRYLTMIIPARWFTGGKGLDEFREEMLSDDRLRQIHDFPDATDVFPGVQIKGGICYFLWDRDNRGLCRVINYMYGNMSVSERSLREQGAETFIRYNIAIPIFRKVKSFNEPSIINLVSTRKPFGFPSNYLGKPKYFDGALKLYKKGDVGWVSKKDILCGFDAMSKYKVFIPFLGSGSDSFPHPILGRPFVGEPGSVCTETYLYIGTFDDEKQAKNLISYIRTRFFRFLVLLNKNSQNATRKVYSFVPMQDFSKPWTDEELYKKYGLTEEEIAFIESMIRPMDNGEETNSVTNGDDDE